MTDQSLSRYADSVDGKSRKQSVADVEPLRDRVEAEGDQHSVGSAGFFGVIESPLEQLVADAPPLVIGRHEQRRQIPRVAADPTPGEAENPPALLRDPKTIAIVLHANQLNFRRPAAAHGSEAITLREIID